MSYKLHTYNRDNQIQITNSLILKSYYLFLVCNTVNSSNDLLGLPDRSSKSNYDLGLISISSTIFWFLPLPLPHPVCKRSFDGIMMLFVH